MKILTWNINGIRALLGKGVWREAEALQPDVICLQEIKARPEQLDETQQAQLSRWQALWNPAERPGYSGVATLLQSEPKEWRFGLGRGEFDQEGRVIVTRHKDFLLFNIYFPNGQRGQDPLPLRQAVLDLGGPAVGPLRRV